MTLFQFFELDIDTDFEFFAGVCDTGGFSSFVDVGHILNDDELWDKQIKRVEIVPDEIYITLCD